MISLSLNASGIIVANAAARLAKVGSNCQNSNWPKNSQQRKRQSTAITEKKYKTDKYCWENEIQVTYREMVVQMYQVWVEIRSKIDGAAVAFVSTEPSSLW